MNANTRSVMELFVEKVQVLKSLSFNKFLLSHGITLSMKRGDNSVTVDKLFPDQESVSAFVLTFRMFMQDNDLISIAKMNKLIDDDSSLDLSFVAQFRALRNELNTYLDNPLEWMDFSTMNVSTPRQLLEVFVYGELAHSNSAKRAQYQQWKLSPLFPVIEFAFVSVLGEFMFRLKKLDSLFTIALSTEPISPTT